MQIHKNKPVIKAQEEASGEVNIPSIGNIVEKIDAETKTANVLLNFFHALADLAEKQKIDRDTEEVREQIRKAMLEASRGCTC